MSDNIRVRIVFEPESEQIRVYGRIFYVLEFVDFMHAQYLSGKLGIKEYDLRNYNKRNEVYYISKQSPLDVGLFIKEHWAIFVVLLTLISRYPNIKTGFKELTHDIESLVTEVEESLKEVTDDFPNFEQDMIREVIQWFLEESKLHKYYFLPPFMSIDRTITKIKRIFNDKKQPPN